MSQIAAIAANDIHKITSGQVIIDLTTAVKELIDNSIDANARHIELIFRNYGFESLDCSDDGDGIKPDNYETLALKHHTSKISSFEDVSCIETLGFRGEALASMCAIANLTVVTTTNPPRADRLEYGFNGRLKTRSTTTRNKGSNFQIAQLFNNLPVRRKVFANNCKREFAKCIALIQSYALIQKEITFTVWHITPNGKKSRILSTGREQEMSKKILNIYGNSSMRGLAPIELCMDLNPFKKHMTRKYVESSTFEGLDYKIIVRGYVSKCSFGCGRNSKDRQSVYINKRPVDYPILLQGCNEIYRSFNNVQYPTIFLNFELSPKLIDVNVTPDKRTILLHNEKFVLDVLKESLTGYYDNQELELPKSSLTQPDSRGTKKRRIEVSGQDSHNIMRQLSQNQERQQDDDIFAKQGTQNEASNEDESARYNENATASEHAESECLRGSDHDNSEFISNQIMPRVEIESKNSLKNGSILPPITDHQSSTRTSPTEEGLQNPETNDSLQNPGMSKSSEKLSKMDSNDRSLERYAHFSTSTKSETVTPIFDKSQSVEVDIDGKKEDLQAAFSERKELIFLPEPASEESCCSHSNSHSPINNTGSCQTGEDSADSADEVDDESYLQVKEPLEVNVRTEVSPIRNQNASMGDYCSLSDSEIKDEDKSNLILMPLSLKEPIKLGSETLTELGKRQGAKHTQSIKRNNDLENFEESENFLTLTVKKDDFIKMQIVGQFNLGFIIVTRKIREKYDMFIVDQHASDEKYNFEMLQKNTVFKSQRLIAPLPVELNVIDEMLVMDNQPIFEKNGFKMTIDENESQGSRVKLYSLPVSKRTLFDVNDFYELVQLIKENGGMHLDSVRPSKIRSMFAMRACRSSIMIGKPLAKKTMAKVVRNLSELDKPWNCPHGRPTMRHLMELRDWDFFTDDYNL